MPKSKRSSKRRAKLKKRQDKTYAWAVRKINSLKQMSPEELDNYLSALDPEELKPTGWRKIKNVNEENQDDLQG